MNVDTMRERFADVVIDLMGTDERIAVVLADIGVGRFGDAGAFDRYPGRVVNVGIREQLMIGVAAGLALEQMRPVAHSYAPFLVERPYEQIKLDFAHQGVGGVFVSIGGSYDAAGEGRTHQAPEDVALMATIPGMNIHVPGHPDELESILRNVVPDDGLHYIRLAATSNAEPHHDTTAGRMALIRRGGFGSPIVLAVGTMLDRTLEATSALDVTVLYAATIRPLDEETLLAFATRDVVLVEPSLEGSTAAVVTKALARRPHRLLSLGVPLAEHRRYGTPAEHDAALGLDAPALAKSIRDFVDC